MDSAYEMMTSKARDIAKYIEQNDFCRIFSHNDGDGITSASILTEAFLRKGIKFQVSFIPKLDENIIEYHKESFDEETPIIFCDIGSSQWNVIKDLKNPIIILDHHKYKETPETEYFLNPETYGISGSDHMCAACVAYLVAKEMSKENIDLSVLALVGIESDRQKMEHINAEILKDAEKSGEIEIRKGLRIGNGLLKDIFMTYTDPYLEITGDEQKIDKFLKENGLDGKKAEDLNKSEMEKLTKLVVEELEQKNCTEGIKAVVGDTVLFKNHMIQNIHDFSYIINSCANYSDFGIAVSVCLNDKSVTNEAINYFKKSQATVVKDMQTVKPLVKKMENINYVHAKDLHTAGEIASIHVRYIMPEKPFICMNEKDGSIRISGRGTHALVNDGLDLAEAFRISAGFVGGNGGGHKISAGTAIPIGKEKEFLTKMDEIVGKQIKN